MHTWHRTRPVKEDIRPGAELRLCIAAIGDSSGVAEAGRSQRLGIRPPLFMASKCIPLCAQSHVAFLFRIPEVAAGDGQRSTSTLGPSRVAPSTTGQRRSFYLLRSRAEETPPSCSHALSSHRSASYNPVPAFISELDEARECPLAGCRSQAGYS